MKEAIIIAVNENFPEEWADYIVTSLDRENFKIKRIKTEDLGWVAAFEWTLPTMVVAYLMKPFFEAFLSEAAKDTYPLAKAELKKFIQKNQAVKYKYRAATQSPHKLSQNYDQSLTISLKVQIHSKLTVIVLFNENVPTEENELMLEGMFQMLHLFYSQCQEEKPDKGKNSDNLSSNEVFLVANNETKQWEFLTSRQMSEKYRNKNKPVTPILRDDRSDILAELNITMDQIKEDVFISYSWDSPEHEQKVINFTNHLRKKGFTAVIDKMITQEKTATNFVRMMHEALTNHKIIVILSKGYKEKAEAFKGGVGEEYEILLNDIKKHEQKYILASFGGRGDEIIPMGLVGRDIVDLSQAGEEKRLFEKLMDHKRYEFAEVGAEKPTLTKIPVQEFAVPTQMVPIEILPPSVRATGDAGFTGDKYRHIEMTILFQFKNRTKRTVDGFAYQVTIHKFLDDDYYKHSVAGEFETLDKTVSGKVFPGQVIGSGQLKFMLNRRNIFRLIDSPITLTVFTDQGQEEQTFIFKDLVMLKRPNAHWTEQVPLSIDLFID